MRETTYILLAVPGQPESSFIVHLLFRMSNISIMVFEFPANARGFPKKIKNSGSLVYVAANSKL